MSFPCCLTIAPWLVEKTWLVQWAWCVALESLADVVPCIAFNKPLQNDEKLTECVRVITTNVVAPPVRWRSCSRGLLRGGPLSCDGRQQRPIARMLNGFKLFPNSATPIWRCCSSSIAKRTKTQVNPSNPPNIPGDHYGCPCWRPTHTWRSPRPTASDASSGTSEAVRMMTCLCLGVFAFRRHYVGLG